MRCPKCNSERIQFGTNTSGGGFSISSSCCGMIALGPMGALCGACGSSTHTEEFWICQDCGNKFDTKEGQKAQEAYEQQKINAETAKKNYIENKQIRSDVLEKFGSIDEFNKKFEEVETDFVSKSEAYDRAYEEFINICSDEIKKKHKKSQYDADKLTSAIAFFFIASVLLVFVFAPLAIVTGAILVLLFIIGTCKLWNVDDYKAELTQLFINSSTEAKKLYDDRTDAANEYLRFENLSEKINACYRYEKNNPVE